MIQRPTWVNRDHLRGPVYHYERITEEQALALGIGLCALPARRCRSTTRRAGLVVRRLKCGRLNVSVEAASGLLRDAACARLIQGLLAASTAVGPACA